jgi:4-hydroxybenzoyl-CoA reductase subunit beta
MHLPRFRLLLAATKEEAAQLMRDHGPASMLLAGGTDILSRMKYRVASPEVLVSLKRVIPEEPTVGPDGELSLDARMTLADVVRSGVVSGRVHVLTEAALAVGSNQIRHMATLGGNLCQETRCFYYNQSHSYQFVKPCFKRNGDSCYLIPKGNRCWAVFMADTVPALVSLKARVKVVATGGSREISIEDVYRDDPLRPLSLSHGEIVDRVMIPGLPGGTGTAFRKFSLRGGLEFAIVNVAARLAVAEDRQTCSEAIIAVGAVAGGPVRARKAEEMLTGEKLNEDLLRSAAEVAGAEVKPVTHHGYSPGYLRHCVMAQTKDALRSAFNRALSDSSDSGS